MVVGLLGVLKAGAAYVPLDSGSARERLKYMVEDSGARLVLSSVSLSSMLSAAQRRRSAFDGSTRVATL